MIEELSAGNADAAALRIEAKHIANLVQLPVMRGLCAARGYRLPELVSPLEMMEN